MIELLVTLRASHLYLHHAHLLAKSSLFLQDHEFLGEIYSELEADFDSVAERIIGQGGEDQLSLPIFMTKVTDKLKNVPQIKDNKDCYTFQLQVEKLICSQIEELCKKPELSQGTKQLIGDIANKSEIRQYKIGRRIK